MLVPDLTKLPIVFMSMHVPPPPLVASISNVAHRPFTHSLAATYSHWHSEPDTIVFALLTCPLPLSFMFFTHPSPLIHSHLPQNSCFHPPICPFAHLPTARLPLLFTSLAHRHSLASFLCCSLRLSRAICIFTTFMLPHCSCYHYPGLRHSVCQILVEAKKIRMNIILPVATNGSTLISALWLCLINSFIAYML